MAKGLSASLEDYLEAILTLTEGEGAAHVKRIAERLEVTMPSVTGALQSLAERRLVNYRPYGAVTLTGRGRKVAKRVSVRHDLLNRFFEEVLGLGAESAEENACRIEHVMDDDALERLASYVEFSETCPLKICTWHGGFGRFCEGEPGGKGCEERLQELVARLRPQETGERKVKELTLDRIKPGQKARILRVSAASGATSQRMSDMGVTRGTVVEVKRVAPLGDPIEVKLKGYHLSLRKEEARGITVELQGEPD